MGQSDRKKAPRRTAERILETTLALFNRHGEPNVSTALIASELGISPGNLHYHYPAKLALTERLLDAYAERLAELLEAAEGTRDLEDAWLFFHMVFELVWQYRFLYRDLNELLSRSRAIETRFQALLLDTQRAVVALLAGLARAGATRIESREAQPVAEAMVVLLTYWLSYEYVRDPRRALEPAQAGAALLRGAAQVLGLLLPYLEPAQREHLLALAGRYRAA